MSMKRTITATIYDDNDNQIEVLGELTPGMKGERDEYGVQLEPDDPASMEIVEACDHNGTSLNLSTDAESAAIDALWDSANES